MKKYTQVSLLFLLLTPFNNYASESKDKKDDSSININGLRIKKEKIKNIALEALPIVSACSFTYLAARAYKLSAFGKIHAAMAPLKAFILAQSTNDNQYLVKNDYPHTETWYKELHKKYPEAGFDTIPLKGHIRWAATHNSIYCPINDAYKINSIYTKKDVNSSSIEKIKQNQQLTCQSEFCALHEACHIHNNDVLTSAGVTIGTGIGIETLFQAYNKKMNIVTRSLPKRIGVAISMFVAHSIITSSYSRHFETRADNFAIKHADDDALIAGKKYFEQSQNLNDLSAFKKSSNLFDTHPSLESRIKAIDNELARRGINNEKN